MSVTGYKWLEEKRHWFLSDERPRDLLGMLTLPPARFRTYILPEAAFRKFAELQKGREAIEAFAKTYGMLGSPRLRTVLPKRDRRDFECWGEHEMAWYSAIESMRQAVDLWDAARDADQSRVREHIRWLSDTTVGYLSHPTAVRGWLQGPRTSDRAKRAAAGKEIREYILAGECLRTTTIAGPGFHGDILTRFPKGHERQLALSFLHRWINREMEDVSPHLEWHPEHNDMRIGVSQLSLLSSLWVQFAEAVAGKAEFRFCKACGQMLPQKRSDAQHCDAGCRVLGYRQRRRARIAARPA